MEIYAVIRKDGTLIDENLTATEAARQVLTYDGYLYEVRPIEVTGPADSLFAAYTSEMSAASYGGPGRMTVIPSTFVYAKDEESAWEKIAAIVIAECGNWTRSPDVMTMTEYEALNALQDEENLT